MKKTVFVSSLLFLIAGWGVKSPVTPVSAQTLLAVYQPANNSTQPQVELIDAKTPA